MDTDDQTRRRILKLLDDARTFEELRLGLVRAVPLHGTNSSLLAGALRFVDDGDATDLDEVLEERFAQVLSRFVESRRALELAGLLEGGLESGRS
jgi:hypothetical protein